MGKNTPGLDHKRKEEYIKLHLFNELRWLLSATTEWSIQDQLNLAIVGYDVQVYAMDSAFLHARALFEFFVQPTNDNHYGSNEFLGRGAVLISSSYVDDWKGPLHRYLMHAQDRSCPAPLKSSGVEKDLNKMPVDFAHEILKLWKEFEERLGGSSDAGDQKLQELGREKRKEAIRGANCVVNSTVAQQHAKERGQQLKPVFVFEG
jgi:hypothetical protein